MSDIILHCIDNGETLSYYVLKAKTWLLNCRKKKIRKTMSTLYAVEINKFLRDEEYRCDFKVLL
jgi:hypothetical protein